MPTNLDAALELASRGFRLIPLYDPGPNGKRPRLNDWPARATTDPAIIRKWWTEWPNANIGAAMGGPMRLVAIDIDGAEGLDSWREIHENEEPFDTLHSFSGSLEGSHRFYIVPAYFDISKIRNRVKFRPGLDVRAEGGFVVLPPSLHEMGNHYTWSNNDPIAPLPAWLYELIASEPTPERPAEAHTPRPLTVERLEAARSTVLALPPAVSGQGGHNALLVAATMAYRGFDLPREAARLVLDDYNRTCAPPWSSSELEHKLSAVEKNERVGEHWGYLLEIDDMAEALRPDEAESSESGTAPSGPIEWVHGPGIAVELEPPRWIVPELQICPGRPTMIAGFGASGKTIISQALVLAYAANRPIWNAFSAGSGGHVVRHLDHEQGRYATLRRYQRLAAGMGVDVAELGDRIGVACFPSIRLNQANAREAYARACAGADVVLIDALRGATPGEDENDSKIRTCIDVLGWVSDKIGCAFILIHHAGKVQQTDKRTGPRGSSAIFDGCGCVLQVVAENREDPKLVEQTKTAAEAEGGLIPSFMLSIDDGDGRSLRVNYRQNEAPQTRDEEMIAAKEQVLAWLEAHPGATKRGVRSGCEGKHDLKDWALEALMLSGEVVNRSADKAKFALYTRNNDTGKFV